MTVRWVMRAGVCALVGAWPVAASANHCEGCNDGLPTQIEVGPSAMPSDGVLVLTLLDANGWLLGEQWWEGVTIEVRSGDGALVEGALELDPTLTPGAWRPAEPWKPGGYTVTVTVDPAHECQLAEFSGTFTADPDLPAPAMPRLVFEASYSTSTSQDLENYVCCDGAKPWNKALNGYACPGRASVEVVFDEGACTRAQSLGTATVTASLDEAAVTRFTLQETTTDARPANSSARLSVSVTEETCLSFEVIDLVTGDRSSVEHCVVEDLGSPLGYFPYPGAEEDIAAECVGPAYVCDSAAGWNVPEACTLWPSEDPVVDSGGWCRIQGPARGTPWLIILALATPRRRREKRTSTHAWKPSR